MRARAGLAVFWCSVLMAGSGLLAGCGASAKSSASPAAGSEAVYAPKAAAPAAGGSGGSGGGLAAGSAQGAPPAAAHGLTSVALTSRDLVFTASLTVGVKNVVAATAEAENLAAANGGFVGDEKATSDPSGSGGISQSTVTLRVPNEKFDSVLNQLGTGGTVEQQDRSASDVTSQVVDTDSRIKSAQASIARLDDLMKTTTGLGDIVSLENELTTRESDLESLESRQAALADQVQLSTITVTYVLPTAAPAVVAPAKKQNPFVRGVSDGWHAFVAVSKVVLIAVGGVLPFVVLAAVLWWPVRRVVRSRVRLQDAAGKSPEAVAVTTAHRPE